MSGSRPHSTHRITEIGHGLVLDEPVNLGSLNWINAAVSELTRLYELEEQYKISQERLRQSDEVIALAQERLAEWKEQLETQEKALKWIVQFTSDADRQGVHTGFRHIHRRAMAALESSPASRQS